MPQSADWGGCGVRYTVVMIETFRRKRTAVTPHQSRFARQLLPKARFAVLKEKPLLRIPLLWNHRAFVRETILYQSRLGKRCGFAETGGKMYPLPPGDRKGRPYADGVFFFVRTTR